MFIRIFKEFMLSHIVNQALKFLLVHRPLTKLFHPVLSWALHSRHCLDRTSSFISWSTGVLLEVLGLPLFFLPCGFHIRACLVIASFRLILRPIYVHFLLRIDIFIGSCLVSSHRLALVAMVLGQTIPKTCTGWNSCCPFRNRYYPNEILWKV